MLDISHRSQVVAVRGQVALEGLRSRVVDGLSRRARALRADGERGAQAVEYAMVGGLSAAACTVLIKLISEHDELFKELLSLVFSGLGRVVRRWF